MKPGSIPVPRRRRLSTPAIVALSVVAIVLLAVLLTGWWLWANTMGYQPPPLPPPSPQAVRQVEQKIDDVRRQIDTPAVPVAGQPAQPRTFRVELTQEDVNAYLSAHGKEIKGIRDLRVEIRPGNVVTVAGWVSKDGRQAWASATGTVRANGPNLAIDVTDMKLGAVSLPGSVQEKLLEEHRQRLSSIPTGLPVSALTVETGEGRVVVTGVGK